MIGAFRRRGARLVVLGVVAYLVFLLVNLPASWLGLALERSSRGALSLGEPAGTVWKGSGLLGSRCAQAVLFAALRTSSGAPIRWRSWPDA